MMICGATDVIPINVVATAKMPMVGDMNASSSAMIDNTIMN